MANKEQGQVISDREIWIRAYEALAVSSHNVEYPANGATHALKKLKKLEEQTNGE